MSTHAIETLRSTHRPSECLLTVEVERRRRQRDRGALRTGNNCPRGDTFAHQALPLRVLTTTVTVSGGDEALLPVRRPKPSRWHFTLTPWTSSAPGRRSPIRMGDVVLENLLGTSINLIASMDIDPA
ncbi:MAG: hypothetical protein ACLU0O_11615 [Collinsella sp.]